MALYRTTSRAPRQRPIVALVTDFGLADHYVGALKGALLSAEPKTTIVDITHDVSPGNIRQAAFHLWAASSSFPKRSVLLGVVDPDVGTGRKILAGRIDQRIFLAPDNGLLDYVWSAASHASVFEVDLQRASGFLSPSISRTFHGRDVFAPLAASLAAGLPLSEIVGKRLVTVPRNPFLDSKRSRTPPAILEIDRFGNIITNVSGTLLNQLAAIRLEGKRVAERSITYAAAPVKRCILLEGSSGLLEIAVRNGSAARLLRANVYSTIRLIWK